MCAEATPPITAARINGVYEQGENQISLLSLGHGKVRVQFDLNNMAAAGFALGDATLDADTLTYGEPPKFTRCKTSIKFLPKGQLDVGVYSDCGWTRVGASGPYRKLKAGVPKFKYAVPVTSDGVPPEGAPSAEAAFEALANTARLDAADTAELAQLAGSTVSRIGSLAARRTSLLEKLKTEQAERTKHAAAAAAGYQKHHAGLAKAASNGAAIDGLKAARAEAAQASTQGQSLLQKLAALRALEEELFQLSSKSVDLSLEASTSAKDAESVSAALQAAAQAKGPKAPAKATNPQLAKSAEAQAQASQAKANAAMASSHATKALQLAGLGPLNGHASRKARNQQEDQKFQRDLAQNRATLGQIEVALKAPAAPPAAVASAGIVGASELPSAEVQKLYGAMATETMETHAEILNAMKVFDPDADVLAMPNDNRAVRLTGGREILLMSGRTCRACAQIGYWIAWEAKSRLVAFVREDENVPVYGKPDPTLRAVLEQFVKQSSLP